MSQLPKYWISTQLEQVAVWGSGGTPSRSNPNYYGGDIAWIKTGELGRRLILSTEEAISDEGLKNSSAKVFPKGSIAIAMYGATIGKVSILGIDAATNQACAVGIPNINLVQREYLYHFLNSQKDAFIKAAKGGAQPNISQTVIKEWKIPLPPLNEQKRIADKLDSILARVDACRERLDRIPAILKRFRQSVLDAATSGKLTEEWRENSCNGSSWQEINVGELLIDIRYGTAKKCHYEPQATPVIRIPNICDGKISHIDLKYAEFDDEERQKLSLVTGDILMIRSNGSVDLVGRTALATEADEGFLYAGYLIRLRVNQQIVNPAYLSLALSAPDARHAIELTARSTSGVNNINTEEIKLIGIKLPNFTEQTEIVRRAESLFAYADCFEARYAAARSRVEKLTPAILAKAFRGELVPQDPSDEPASALLERIQASRAEVAVSAKPKRSQNRNPAAK